MTILDSFDSGCCCVNCPGCFRANLLSIAPPVGLLPFGRIVVVVSCVEPCCRIGPVILTSLWDRLAGRTQSKLGRFLVEEPAAGIFIWESLLLYKAGRGSCDHLPRSFGRNSARIRKPDCFHLFLFCQNGISRPAAISCEIMAPSVNS
jgi:hypothetical protein